MSGTEIEQRAAAWVLRRDEGEWGPRERQELELWLAQDAKHRAAYLQLTQAWRFAGGLKSWRPVDAPVNADLFAPRSARVSLVKGWPLALAASVTLVAAVVWGLWQMPEVYSTRVGGYQRVVLDDGSVLQLNTNSKVRVNFSAQRREVRLLRGETYFEIARDPNRPFDVTAADTVVRAVGTAFSVRLRAQKDVEVVVTQGRVMLREEGEDFASGMQVVQAEAGQTAESKPTGLSVKPLRKEELSRRLAWQSGQLDFQRQPLDLVVTEFNRYNRRTIEIADPQLAQLEVHGHFKATDLDSFLVALEKTLNVRVEQSEDAIRLFAR